MLLCAYKINNTPASNIDTIDDADLNGNAAYKVADSLPSGYADISSIENWALYGIGLIGSTYGFRDWKCLQREIKSLALVIVDNDFNANWNNLNANEKKIVCQYILSSIPPAKFGQTYPNADERTAIINQFDLNNRRARGNWQNGTGRTQAMRIFLFSKIGKNNAMLTLVDAVKENLLELYEGGIEGTVEDGIAGINDFLLARDGTVYETNGLAARNYAVVDGSTDTLADVADALVDISSNGMY
jgi:hypothetical protein